MKTIVIQLDAHDDLISVRDKMVWSKAQRILLVWPKKGHPGLFRKYDLVSLQRHAIELGAQLGLVTHDSTVNANARELGIAIFRSPKQAQRQHWQRKRSQKPVQWAEQKAAMVSGLRLREPQTDEKPSLYLMGWTRLTVFTVGVLAVLVLGTFLLPGATVIVKPVQKEQSLSMNLIVDPKLASPSISGQIPADTVSTVIEVQGQISTSGKTSIPDRKAGGLVTLTNLTNRSRILPAGSVISVEQPQYIQFGTSQEAILPAGLGKTVEVSILALEGGSRANLKANAKLALEGPMGPDISVTNLKVFSGGSDRTLPSVAQSDYDSLRRQLLDTLKTNAKKDLETSLGTEKTLLTDTLTIKEIAKESLVPEVGDPGDELILSLQAVVSALAVANKDIEQIAESALDARLTGDQLPVPSSLSVKPALNVVEQADGQFEMNIIVSRKTVADLSNGKMLTAVQGKRPEIASRYLSSLFDLEEQPQIRLTPSWWFWMPSIGFRIQFEVQ